MAEETQKEEVKPYRDTARMAVAAIYPDHGLHTATALLQVGKDAVIYCDCGQQLLLTEPRAAAAGTTMAALRVALRNVPPLEVKAGE
jgi:hypothetical protein